MAFGKQYLGKYVYIYIYIYIYMHASNVVGYKMWWKRGKPWLCFCIQRPCLSWLRLLEPVNAWVAFQIRKTFVWFTHLSLIVLNLQERYWASPYCIIGRLPASSLKHHLKWASCQFIQTKYIWWTALGGLCRATFNEIIHNGCFYEWERYPGMSRWRVRRVSSRWILQVKN